VLQRLPKAAKRPAFGCVISRFATRADRKVPRYVSLDQYYANHAEWRTRTTSALRTARSCFAARHQGPEPDKGLTLDRLAERKASSALDTLRRDSTPVATSRRWIASRPSPEMITSPKARDAFDLAESPNRRPRALCRQRRQIHLRQRPDGRRTPGRRQVLVGPRLVEAGVAVVTLRIGTWDYHGKVLRHRQHLHRLALQCRCSTTRSTPGERPARPRPR